MEHIFKIEPISLKNKELTSLFLFSKKGKIFLDKDNNKINFSLKEISLLKKVYKTDLLFLVPFIFNKKTFLFEYIEDYINQEVLNKEQNDFKNILNLLKINNIKKEEFNINYLFHMKLLKIDNNLNYISEDTILLDYFNIENNFAYSSFNKDSFFLIKDYISNKHEINNLNKQTNSLINYNIEEFLEIIKKSFEEGFKNKRGTDRVKNIHKYIANLISSNLNNSARYVVRSFGVTDSNYNFISNKKNNLIKFSSEGIHQNKDNFSELKVDIDIIDLFSNKKAGACLIKFIFSNYKQNKNNYNNSATGEYFRFLKNIPTFDLTIIFNKIPYFYNNNKLKKIEEFNQLDFLSRTKIFKDLNINSNCNISNHILVLNNKNFSNKQEFSDSFRKEIFDNKNFLNGFNQDFVKNNKELFELNFEDNFKSFLDKIVV
jgi:hypothetical protein